MGLFNLFKKKAKNEEIVEYSSETLEEWYQLGRNYEYGKNGVVKDVKQAIHWYTKAAERGHTKAQFNLGMCYYLDATYRDMNKMSYWFKKAVENGFHLPDDSLYSLLGDLHREKGNKSESMYWYTKGAELNIAEAQYRLFERYTLGDTVREDLKKSQYWLRKAAANGHAPAIEMMNQLEKKGLLL